MSRVRFAFLMTATATQSPSRVVDLSTAVSLVISRTAVVLRSDGTT
ncbi:hypothetical protein V5E97_06555 [Singulisphaera sp. Ch08]|uniref:Uncharacterized protein n=1 Tax=Singulisphaera sp. Ch08 TaxID=3120278 RepID=A0AAU7CJP6_9BACT